MRLSVTSESFPLAEVFTISRGSKTAAEVVTVRVSDGRAEGWGECVPYARYNETIASVSAEVEGLPEDFDRRALQSLLPAGAARNAVDCALWDLEAKRAGKRAWDLAGLPKPGPEITAYTLSLSEPDAMEAAARKHAHRPLLKIKLGTADDMARLEAVRRGAPKSRIIVDANEGWSADIYSDLAPHMVRLGVALVEQPLPAGEDDMLAEIARPLPVCADESCHDSSTLAALKGKYDVINIKLDKTGGLTEALALAAEARQAGKGLMVGNMLGTSLSMAPAFVIAQLCDFVDLDGPLNLKSDLPGGMVYRDGEVAAPQTGLWG